MGIDIGENDPLIAIFCIGCVSSIIITFGYVSDYDYYYGLIGLWVTLLGILGCLIFIVYENAVQTNIVEEQLMELNREVVRWRESQKPGKKK